MLDPSVKVIPAKYDQHSGIQKSKETMNRSV